jgi:hypothetical protein
MFIPDPDPEFLPIPDPGVKKAPDPGSGTLRKTINSHLLAAKKKVNWLDIFGQNFKNLIKSYAWFKKSWTCTCFLQLWRGKSQYTLNAE